MEKLKQITQIDNASSVIKINKTQLMPTNTNSLRKNGGKIVSIFR